jgi:hypothetical protein
LGGRQAKPQLLIIDPRSNVTGLNLAVYGCKNRHLLLNLGIIIE